MGHRLSAIATRTGDKGTTGLGDGSRCPKDAPRVQALGDVDELNSHIGLLLCEPMPEDIRTLLGAVQHDLFDLGGELAVPGMRLVRADRVQAMDVALAHYNAVLPPLQEFILPGGSRAGAQAHVCRTVARRAERALVAALSAETGGVPQGTETSTLPYLNRLSDLLFVLARTLNRAGTEGSTEVYWKHARGGSNEST